MASFFLLLLLWNVNSQTVCMWGQDGASNTALNGEYSYNGDYNGAASYIKTLDASCDPQTYYLYRANDADSSWIIHTELQTSASITFYARCASSDLSACTSSGNWNGSVSMNIYAIEGSCPAWECSYVETTETYAGCEGPFTGVQGDNIWSNADGSWWFYFVPHLFSWVCNAELANDNCPTSYYAVNNDGWYDLALEDSYTASFTAGGATNTRNVTCLGSASPTTTPSKAPSSSPTNPTEAPSPSPTTAAPTSVPTTRQPTSSPTLSPTTSAPVTASPAAQPSDDPTKSPVLSTPSPNNGGSSGTPSQVATPSPNNVGSGGTTTDSSSDESGNGNGTGAEVDDTNESSTTGFVIVIIILSVLLVLAGLYWVMHWCKNSRKGKKEVYFGNDDDF